MITRGVESLYAKYQEENDRPEVNDYLREMRVKEVLFNGILREIQKLMKEESGFVYYQEEDLGDITEYGLNVLLISGKRLAELLMKEEKFDEEERKKVEEIVKNAEKSNI